MTMFVMFRERAQKYPWSELMHFQRVQEKTLVQIVPSPADRLPFTLMTYAAAGQRKRLGLQFLEQTFFR